MGDCSRKREILRGDLSMIAALFVESSGVYAGLPGVDVWDLARDARLYAGPYPVVAHPPCERWGRYWSGGPSAKIRRQLGDDGGCFSSALRSVRLWGGVLEHPEASHAWAWYGLRKPPRCGGWIQADDFGGWTCCIEQGQYGHPARKATWLYLIGTPDPHLLWGKSEGRARLDQGYHSAEERRMRPKAHTGPGARLTPRECLSTPVPFRDLLLSMAKGKAKI